MRKLNLVRVLCLLVVPATLIVLTIELYAPELKDPEGRWRGMPWKAALTLLWMSILLVFVGILTYFLSPEYALRRSRRKVPALVRDLIRYGLFIVLSAIILKALWGDKVTPLIGALGIGGVVLGLALQETLSNFFAGLALVAERPFAHGDWVRIGERDEGRVEQITWRATKIRTRESDFLIFPNSVVAREVVQNFHMPSDVQALRLTIGTSYWDPPDKVKKVLRDVLAGTHGVLENPAPIIYLTSYADFSINYEIKLFTRDYGSRREIEDDVMSRIWYAFQRADIEIPFPIRTVYAHRVREDRRELKGRVDVLGVLRTVALFEPLGAEPLARLAENVRVAAYGDGEPVVHQGEPGEEMFVIVEGAARVEIETGGVGRKTVASLSSGSFFGEMSLLTGQFRTATVRAEGGLKLVVIGREALQPILLENSSVAEALAEIVTARREELQEARIDVDASGEREMTDDGRTTLLKRIQQFFGL